MAKVVARLSGIVSYTDGSWGQFATMIDDQGRVSYNGKPIAAGGVGNQDSAENLAEAYAGISASTWLTATLDLLPGLNWIPVAGDGDLPATWVSSKVVNGVITDFSGRVTIDDAPRGYPSWEDFHVCFWMHPQDDGTIIGAFADTVDSVEGGDTNAIGAGGTSAWDKILADATLFNALNSMLSPLGFSIIVAQTVGVSAPSGGYYNAQAGPFIIWLGSMTGPLGTTAPVIAPPGATETITLTSTESDSFQRTAGGATNITEIIIPAGGSPMTSFYLTPPTNSYAQRVIGVSADPALTPYGSTVAYTPLGFARIYSGPTKPSSAAAYNAQNPTPFIGRINTPALSGGVNVLFYSSVAGDVWAVGTTGATGVLSGASGAGALIPQGATGVSIFLTCTGATGPRYVNITTSPVLLTGVGATLIYDTGQARLVQE